MRALEVVLAAAMVLILWPAVAAALDVTSSYLTAEAEKHFHLAAQEQS